jgi:hypothetical protein
MGAVASVFAVALRAVMTFPLVSAAPPRPPEADLAGHRIRNESWSVSASIANRQRPGRAQ